MKQSANIGACTECVGRVGTGKDSLTHHQGQAFSALYFDVDWYVLYNFFAFPKNVFYLGCGWGAA